MDKLIYLASPYTSQFPDITERRVRQVQDATAKFIEQGYLIFSPIINSHPITDLVSFSAVNTEDGMSPWMDYDRAMIDRSDELWVLCLDGWQDSLVIEAEVAHALQGGKPVKYFSYPELRENGHVRVFNIKDTFVGAGDFYSPPSNGKPPIKKFEQETHTTYQPGDRVRVIANGSDDRHSFEIGEVTTITGAGVHQEYGFRYETEDGWYVLPSDITRLEVIPQADGDSSQDCACHEIHVGKDCFGQSPKAPVYPAPDETGTQDEEPRREQIIIGLNGVAQSGKDTVGAYLVETYGFTRIGLADAVRDAALALDPVVGLTQEALLEELTLWDFFGLQGAWGAEGLTFFTRLSTLVSVIGWERAKKFPAVRTTLQKIGTDAGRAIHGDHIWLDIAKKKIAAAYPNPVVITDIRFDNEAEFVKALGGEVCEVKRQGVEAINGHASEQPLTRVDWVLPNHLTIADLYGTVDWMIERL
jgi:hypothetical protein